MKVLIDIPFDEYKTLSNISEKERVNALSYYEQIISNGKPYEKSLQGELANEVWHLYEKHQTHLATHVIEFGDELKELLGKYQKTGATNNPKECKACDYYKLAQSFINGIVEVISKNGITSLDELLETLKKGAKI